MGADWLQLFDKRLCDEIVRLDANRFSGFVERHLHLFGEFSLFRHDFDGVPVADRIQRLLDGGDTEAGLRARLVDELCFSERRVVLDYWGCYVEVFAGADPDGPIADYMLLPDRREQSFLLLSPNHIDRILESLDAHRTELTIMAEAELSVVRKWREICAVDSCQMVAYVFDV